MVALRIKGFTLQEIGDQLGISKQSVHGHLMKAIEDHNKDLAETVPVVTRLELERLDHLFQVAFDQATVKKDLKAIDQVLKVMERRARLMGLDKPVKQETAVTFGSMSGQDLLAEADRQGVEVSPELRKELGGDQPQPTTN